MGKKEPLSEEYSNANKGKRHFGRLALRPACPSIIPTCLSDVAYLPTPIQTNKTSSIPKQNPTEPRQRQDVENAAIAVPIVKIHTTQTKVWQRLPPSTTAHYAGLGVLNTA